MCCLGHLCSAGPSCVALSRQWAASAPGTKNHPGYQPEPAVTSQLLHKSNLARIHPLYTCHWSLQALHLLLHYHTCFLLHALQFQPREQKNCWKKGASFSSQHGKKRKIPKAQHHGHLKWKVNMNSAFTCMRCDCLNLSNMELDGFRRTE